MRKGSYIVIEGGEHVGKTTQVERVAAAIEATKVREPGDTPIGEMIRDMLLDPKLAKEPETQALLHAAQRRELAETRIRPMLTSGISVVSDRSWLSSAVYQKTDGVPLARIRELNRFALKELIQPDLYVVLDADPLTVHQRAADEKKDYYENKGDNYHQLLRKGYLEIGLAEGAVIIDATQDVNTVTQRILHEIEDRDLARR